jgi:hypothetical protein
LSTLKLARPMISASVIWVATPGFVAELATAYVSVRQILGVLAMQVLRRALATRTPTAIVHRELNAFVSVLVTAILLLPAFAIQALRAHVTPVQRARVVSVRPVPVQDCVVVVRDPSVCVVLARHVRVQDCVPVTLARIVHAMQARHVLVSQVRRAPAV